MPSEDRLGHITQFAWCDCGELDSITDPLNHTTTWTRDVLGRVTRKTYHDGKYADYAYDSRAGRLKSVTDAKAQVKNYAYNVDGTLKGVSYVNEQVSTPDVTFTYDPKYRRPATMTDGTGLTSFGYHPVTDPGTLGARRLATVDGPLANDTITYLYDELGRITNRAINGVGEGFAFDTLGRLANHDNVLGTFTSAYVGDTFRLSSVTPSWPNVPITTFDNEPTVAETTGLARSRFDEIVSFLGPYDRFSHPFFGSNYQLRMKAPVLLARKRPEKRR